MAFFFFYSAAALFFVVLSVNVNHTRVQRKWQNCLYEVSALSFFEFVPIAVYNFVHENKNKNGLGPMHWLGSQIKSNMYSNVVLKSLKIKKKQFIIDNMMIHSSKWSRLMWPLKRMRSRWNWNWPVTSVHFPESTSVFLVPLMLVFPDRRTRTSDRSFTGRRQLKTDRYVTTAPNLKPLGGEGCRKLLPMLHQTFLQQHPKMLTCKDINPSLKCSTFFHFPTTTFRVFQDLVWQTTAEKSMFVEWKEGKGDMPF